MVRWIIGSETRYFLGRYNMTVLFFYRSCKTNWCRAVWLIHHGSDRCRITGRLLVLHLLMFTNDDGFAYGDIRGWYSHHRLLIVNNLPNDGSRVRHVFLVFCKLSTTMSDLLTDIFSELLCLPFLHLLLFQFQVPLHNRVGEPNSDEEREATIKPKSLPIVRPAFLHRRKCTLRHSITCVFFYFCSPYSFSGHHFIACVFNSIRIL